MLLYPNDHLCMCFFRFQNRIFKISCSSVVHILRLWQLPFMATASNEGEKGTVFVFVLCVCSCVLCVCSWCTFTLSHTWMFVLYDYGVHVCSCVTYKMYVHVVRSFSLFMLYVHVPRLWCTFMCYVHVDNACLNNTHTHVVLCEQLKSRSCSGRVPAFKWHIMCFWFCITFVRCTQRSTCWAVFLNRRLIIRFHRLPCRHWHAICVQRRTIQIASQLEKKESFTHQ